VSLWKEQDRKVVDDTTGHKKAVSCMVWNAKGTRLVTGDQVEHITAAWPFNQSAS
jgi:WD40 repeat protein